MSRNEGFICPTCGQSNFGMVVDTRQHNFWRRRRRECEKCHKRYTTFEILIRNNREMRIIKEFVK